MPANLGSQATKSAKDLAREIAKQMAGELPEVLKTAGSQVTGMEKPQGGERSQEAQPQGGNEAKIMAHQQELQDKMKAGRRMEALDRELDDIRKQAVFKDLQRRISEGEEPPLEDFEELSMEQKQVLKAQMEAVKFQQQQAAYQASQEKGSLFGSAKRSRKMGAGNKGQKGEAEKQQTRVEKPVPPSG
jgi:hypothetical protein